MPHSRGGPGGGGADSSKPRGGGGGSSVSDLIRSWPWSCRPEIEHKALVSHDVLDERHDRRSVRVVAWRPHGGKKVDEELFALKIIERGRNDSHLDRIFNEKNIMIALDSPWHTKLVSTFMTDADMYMLLEYAPSLSVDQHIEWGRGLRRGGVPMARLYSACVLLGLQHMHRRGIVHRDIKPGNFLIDAQGYVKLCDYGLSKFLPLGERTRTHVGTLAYIPPEQLRMEPYGHATDLWSLGVSLYEMVHGVTPFEPRDRLLSDAEWKAALDKAIRAAAFRLPANRSPLPARLFMKALLAREPETRLGVRHGGSVDALAVMGHSFFTTIDWSALANRRHAQFRTTEGPSEEDDGSDE